MKLVNKIVPIATYVITLILLVVMFMQYSSDKTLQGPSTGLGIAIAEWLIYFCILGIALSFVFALMSDAKSVLMGLIGVVVFFVLYGIAYGMADNSVEGSVYAKMNVDADLSQFISAVLNLSYLLGLLCVVWIVVVELINFVKGFIGN